VFILASIVVPVIANGFRALGIVSLGYVLGSAEAAATDHVLYGWIFFSVVILLLIVLGLPFRQDEMASRALPEQIAGERNARRHENARAGAPAAPFPARRFAITALAVPAIAAIGPLVATGFDRAVAAQIVAPSAVDAGQGCSAGPAQTPADQTAPGRLATQRVTCGSLVFDVTTETFSPHSTAAPVLAERRRLSRPPNADESAESWLQGTPGARPTWRIITSAEPAYVVAVAAWTEGKPVRLGLAMRASMARSSLTGTRYTPVVMTVTPDLDWKTLRPQEIKQAESALRQFLLAHPGLGAQGRSPAD
jgi:hypothetical protein